MKPSAPLQFEVILRHRLAKSQRIAIVGVGDVVSPLDRSGMSAAGEIEKLHLPNVKVFLAGTVPENITRTLRAYQPDHVIFLDAADMGVKPGSIQVIEPENAQENLVSSHVMPLSVVMEFIAKDTGGRVILLGIQPDLTQADHDLSGPEQVLLQRNLLALADILRSVR
jgi:hydrogenase 3 maturation protease